MVLRYGCLPRLRGYQTDGDICRCFFDVVIDAIFAFAAVTATASITSSVSSLFWMRQELKALRHYSGKPDELFYGYAKSAGASYRPFDEGGILCCPIGQQVLRYDARP